MTNQVPKKKKTRNPQGMGSIRQRPNGTWEGRYTLGVDPATGKQLQRSVYGKTQKIVKDKLLKINLELSQGIYSEPTNITVSEWLDIWLDEYTNHLKYSTISSYKTTTETYFKPLIGHIKLSKLTTTTIQRMYNTLLNNGISPSSLKLYHTTLNRALNVAIKTGYIKNNPATVCIIPKPKKRNIKPMDTDTLNRLIKAYKNHPHETIFYTALFTGMRIGEILGLTWDNINLDNGTILVSQQLYYTNKGYILAPTKSNNSRLLTPPPTLINILTEHKQKQQEKQTLAGEHWQPNIPNLVFTTDTGKNYPRRKPSNEFKKVLVQAGITENYTFHDIRHAYTTNAILAGEDVKTLQEQLGHSSAAFTLDIYAQVNATMRLKSANKMEAFITNNLNLPDE